MLKDDCLHIIKGGIIIKDIKGVRLGLNFKQYVYYSVLILSAGRCDCDQRRGVGFHVVR